MKRLVLWVVALVGLMIVGTGCVGTAPVAAPKTPIHAHFVAPISINPNGTDLGKKVGRSTNQAYFGLVSIGNISIAETAANAGITKIKHVEYEYTNACLFLYQETTIIVYGD